MVFRILSLDGGGIRGIYTATILTALERDLNNLNNSLTGKISDYFDLIVGTSTGGIITALLLCPDANGAGLQRGDRRSLSAKYSAADILELYKTRGDEIFHSSFKKVITSLNGLIDERYSSDAIKGLLDKYGNGVLLSQLIKPCVITSYDTVTRAPHLFKQHRAINDPTREFSMTDVCLATSAAPTYFEPVLVKNSVGEEFSLIDGVFVENNPSLCGYIEGLKLADPEEPIVLVSIGAGINCRPYTHHQIKDIGLIQWISPIIEMLLDGRTQTPDYMVHKIFEDRGEPENYFRITSTLPEELTSMDNISKSNLKGLINAAKQTITKLETTGEWVALCAALKPQRAR